MENIYERLGRRIYKPVKRIEFIKTKKNAQALLDILDEAYVKGESLIDDDTYDSLRLEMNEKWKGLESKIGHKTDDDDVKLPIPMASLNQLYRGSEKLQNALKKKLRLSDKLDGQSIEVVYRDNRPVSAYTRGDADYGKDISHHIPHMRIPQFVSDALKNVTVRFEAIIQLKLFNKHLHKDVGGKYVAARNCVAGLTRSFKPLPLEFQYIDFIAFAIIGGTGSTLPQSKQFKLLKSEMFKVAYSVPAKVWTEEELIAHYDDRMLNSKYELDGIVCTRNIEPEVPSNSNPKHAFKFKINSLSDSVIVEVKRIEWEASKYGRLTPVAIYDPTLMPGGVTCTNATCHNAHYVMYGQEGKRDKKTKEIIIPKKKYPIGVGAKIRIIRSGKVIPYIMEIVEPAKEPSMPDVPYKIEGVHAIIDEHTDDITERLFNSFFTDMEFTSQGPSTSKALVEYGITDVYKLYGITKKRAISLLGQAKGKALIASIEKSREETNIVSWLTATAPFYMQGSAKTTFQKIIDEIPDIASYENTHEMLIAISNIKGIKSLAPKLTSTIIDSLSLAFSCNVHPTVILVERTSDKLHDIVAGFSGLTDKQLMQEIQEAGGAASRNMTSATNVLIVKDTGASSSKIEKAKAKGILIVTPAQFREKFLE